MNNEMKLVPCKLCGTDPWLIGTDVKCRKLACPNMGTIRDINGAAWNRLNAPDAPAPAQAETRAARRERIAVAVFSNGRAVITQACNDAEYLMAELDRRAALDAESAKGGAA